MSIIRALATAFFVLFSFFAHAQQADVLSRPYKPTFTQGAVKAFLDDLETRTGVSISYSNAAVAPDEKVTLTGNEATVHDVLTAIVGSRATRIVTKKNKILLVPQGAERKIKAATVTLNGYVKETGSMEALPGAVVFIPALGVGTATNSYGYYSISVPAGNYDVVCAFVGYNADTTSMALKEDSRIDKFLSVQNALEEVKVTADKQSIKDRLRLTYANIKERPSLLGETDVMRALQNYAGTTASMEGSNKIVVRGGDPGQNLHLIDGVPLYYIDHFFGFTSVFNSEAIKSADFFKGAFPAKYGGRLSSVIDINSKDGDMEHWGGQFSLGLLKGSFNLEGPLVKNKSSVMISLRRTWIDALWRFASPVAAQTKIDFYDINVKANYILDKNNRLYLSVYNGRDQIDIDPGGGTFATKWGNALVALKWNRILNPQTFLNTTVTFSRFKFSLLQREDIFVDGVYEPGKEYKGLSEVKDAGFTSSISWYPNPAHKVETGIRYSYARFVPVQVQGEVLRATVGNKAVSEQFYSNEVTLYAEDEIKAGERWTLRPGFHFANWFSRRFNYSGIQPRMYVSYRLAQRHLLYASVAQMAQFIHLMTNNTLGLPGDFWIPSTANIKPEESYTATLGYGGSVGKQFNYNAELYYRTIKNVTTYGMGKNLFSTVRSWEDNITQGTGKSYGIELSASEKIGVFKLTGAYTWSHTTRRFADLNDGNPFPYRYDRRHNIRAALVYKPSARFDASANWTYMSGEAITLPDQLYPDLDKNLMVSPGSGVSSAGYTYNYVTWNNYRLPPIHRLDLAMNFTKQVGRRKRMQRIWSFGVYNAYARHNVMFVELTTDVTGGMSLQALSFLKFVPFVNYQLLF